MHTIFEYLGADLSDSQRQPMNEVNDFLGVTHEYSPVQTYDVVELWPRERLDSKVLEYIAY